MLREPYPGAYYGESKLHPCLDLYCDIELNMPSDFSSKCIATLYLCLYLHILYLYLSQECN